MMEPSRFIVAETTLDEMHASVMRDMLSVHEHLIQDRDAYSLLNKKEHRSQFILFLF